MNEMSGSENGLFLIIGTNGRIIYHPTEALIGCRSPTIHSSRNDKDGKGAASDRIGPVKKIINIQADRQAPVPVHEHIYG